MGTARLVREALDWDLPPERAALLVREDPHPFALIGEWAAGGSVIGSAPIRIARPDEDPFELLDEQPRVEDPGAPGAVGGGWFGRLGFGLSSRIEQLHPGPPRPVPLPDFALAFYDHVLVCDAVGRWWFEALATPARAAALRARRLELDARARAGPAARPYSTSAWRAMPGLDGHAIAVAACRERIHAGDLFQASLTLRLEAGLAGDPIDLFAQGVRVLRPPRAAYCAGPWGAVASLSPELFLERRGREVLTAPIKGTRPLGERAALVDSAKDRAENVMIVDLMRNDLGKVCEPGSVRVPILCEPREHTGVWHLVSEVRGALPDGVGDAALLRASFPPGSVTGAPKPAALDVISELESTRRETYTGAIGFASPVAGLELNVAIRSFEHRDGRLWLGIGGGVVADSNPSAEATECETKAAPLLAAIGAAWTIKRDGGAAAPPVRRLGPRPVPRPDPKSGVFTTLPARDGLPVAANLHLERLNRSVLELYGEPLPAEARRGIDEAAARSLEPARLRLTVVPDDLSGVVRLHLERTPLPPVHPVRLRTVTLPGGLGEHKWVDRRLLDSLTAHRSGDLALLVDLDGQVLEAGRATIFIREADRLVTPPLDGRILPGVTRARLIEVAGGRVDEEPFDLERLLASDGVLVTGALREAQAAMSCDGRVLPPSVEAAALLNRELNRLLPALDGSPHG